MESPPMFSDPEKEIEFVKRIVALRFPIYDTRVTPQAVQFLVTVDPATMEERFEDLRKELVPQNYIPFLAREGGEHAILVQRRPEQRFVSWHMNLTLLLLTIATTMWAGATLWEAYAGVPWASLEALGMGTLTFTVPLMTVLGIHEMGHYVMARRYKVHASLPFFIPAPFTLLGTFGAMISLRDPMPNRKALIDVGASGPILGLLTAIPVAVLGLFLMAADPRPAPLNPGGNYLVGEPILYTILSMFIPIPAGASLHPTAFAGWVGLFVTALNLLPAGQLDGGHVARAVLGDNSRYASYGALGLMFVLGFAFPGWYIIAIFILLMGARHPPPLNDLSRLDPKRYGLALAVVAVLVLSFVAVPLVPIEPRIGLQFEEPGNPDVAVPALAANVTNQSTAPYAFVLRNVGNLETNVTLVLERGSPEGVGPNASFSAVQAGNRTVAFEWNVTSFTLNATESANITVTLDATDYQLAPDLLWTFHVQATAAVEGFRGVDADVAFTVRVVP